MRLVSAIVLGLSLFLVAGCTTSAHFVVPQGADLMINNRPVTIASDGRVKTAPFSYGCAKGVPYLLTKNGQTIGSGKLATSFSIWMPTWAPYKFAQDTYDLSAVAAPRKAAPGKRKRSPKH